MNLKEEYHSRVAAHYAAFRPALHSVCLARMLSPTDHFRLGLDIGCGTGYSAVALTAYCEQVIAVDPSQSMLDQAQSHDQIRYLCGSGNALDQLVIDAAEIVTFAGALFYAKSESLRRNLRNVLKPGGLVLVYDFEVLLDDVMKTGGVDQPAVASDYDHATDLSDWPEFTCIQQGVERVQLQVTAEQLAHILLSDSNRYNAFVAHFSAENPFAQLVERFTTHDKQQALSADIYFARYQFI